jgi:hypothetical protein
MSSERSIETTEQPPIYELASSFPIAARHIITTQPIAQLTQIKTACCEIKCCCHRAIYSSICFETKIKYSCCCHIKRPVGDYDKVNVCLLTYFASCFAMHEYINSFDNDNCCTCKTIFFRLLIAKKISLIPKICCNWNVEDWLCALWSEDDFPPSYPLIKTTSCSVCCLPFVSAYIIDAFFNIILNILIDLMTCIMCPYFCITCPQ